MSGKVSLGGFDLITLHFLHTNDIHSHFDNWGSLVSYLKIERTRLQQEQEPCLTIDLGDNMDRVNPLTEGLLGKGNVQLLNEAAYDYATIGNNEGITFTKEQLESVYQDRKFKIVLANLFEPGGSRPEWCDPYIVQNMGGVKVGLIGLTAAFPKFYQLLGWTIRDPLSELITLVRKLRGQVDVLVLLSHVGLPFDERVAREVEGIDVIIGAHTHHALERGLMIDQTLIAQAGKYGKYAGHIVVEFDESSRRVVHKGADLVTLREAADPAAAHLVKELTEAGISRMREPVACLDHALPVDWFRDCAITQIMADALRSWCKADVGLVNSGVILDGLPAGTVSRYAIHHICPHPINPCKVTVSGGELIEMIDIGLRKDFQTYELKGFGFRGKLLGKLVFSNLEYRKEYRAGRLHATEVTVKGAPIVREKAYSVGTIDMFTFGSFLPPIVRAKQQFFLPETLRDILAWRLKTLDLIR